MMGYIIGLIGAWILQDAVASVMFYPSEKWKWNHFVRIIRAVFGVVLIVIGGSLISES